MVPRKGYDFYLGCSSGKVTVVAEDSSNPIPSVNLAIPLGVKSYLPEGRLVFSGPSDGSDDCSWGSNSGYLTDFVCNKRNPDTSQTIQVQNGNIYCSSSVSFSNIGYFNCENNILMDITH